MPSIRIQDKRKDTGRALGFDLRDILAEIGEPVLTSRWRCQKVWCTAIIDGAPFEFRDDRFKLSGEELVKIALEVHQTIDGRFEAKGQGAAKKPWLVIVAHDSSFYEVWSSKPWVIEKLKARFEDVTDFTGDLSEPAW